MVTLSDVLDNHCRALRVRAKPRSAATAAQRSAHLARHFGPSFDVAGLSARDLEGFIEARLAAGASRQTVNGLLAVLKAALNRAVEHELLERPPCRVKLLKIGRRIPRVLSPEQVARLARIAPAPVDLMLLLAADAGLRHQEVLHLQTADVDLAAGVLRVTAKPGWSPKSHHEREIPLTRRLSERLAAHMAGRSGWLFPGYEGEPLRGAHDKVRAVFEAAGLYDPEAKPGLHQLRRTWATLMLGHADVETVRQLGGWRDLVTVQSYVTTTDDRKRAAIAGLEG